MRLTAGLSSQALGLELGEQVGARPLAGLRVSRTTAQTLVAAAIVPMVGVTVALALASEHLQRPVASALYWSYLTAAPMTIGLLWWMRRPASRFGPLLVLFGILAWLVSWESSDWPLAFDVAVLVEGPAFWLAMYLFLAFPMGRLEPPAAWWLMAALAFAVVGFFLPWALFSPVIAGGGPLTSCAPNCPPNVLQLASEPRVVEVAGKAETYAVLAIVAAVFVVYLLRLRTASRPQRRALIAVAVTSLLYLPAVFAYQLSAWILELDPATVDVLAWVLVGARVLLPLGFLIALLQAEGFAARALRVLLERLVARPTPEQWRDTIAGALDDRPLQLGFHDPVAGIFREPSGARLTPPAPDAGRAWVPVDRDDHPVAAMVIDETLTKDPELVAAAASATLLAVENGALEGELQASRVRILEAGHAERRRIERDLHDSAQQRLVALRIHLTLVSEQLDPGQERAMLERLGGEVEQAIDELRDLARGVYPQLLGDLGLAAALEAVTRQSATPVSITDEGLTRHTEALETTVYFCCLECLQNAAKHAGSNASVTIKLGEHDGLMTFSVADDGVGFDPASAGRGLGLDNLESRVAAVGGSLRIDARPGHGTHITGELPIPGT